MSIYELTIEFITPCTWHWIGWAEHYAEVMDFIFTFYSTAHLSLVHLVKFSFVSPPKPYPLFPRMSDPSDPHKYFRGGGERGMLLAAVMLYTMLPNFETMLTNMFGEYLKKN